MNRRHFVAMLGATPWVITDRAFGQLPASSWKALERLLADYVGAKKLAGAAIAVSDDGSPATCLKAGRIAFDADVFFDEDTVCRIYSMTKVVTGLAAMLLVENGSIGLDQPVADFVPELRTPHVAVDAATGLDARPARRTMTIRHLLTHSAGLAYWTPGQGTDALSTAYRERGITPGNYGTGLRRPGYGPQAAGLDDMVKRLAEVPLAAEPGTVWRYSVGLDVMGLIIQRVTGKPLDVFTRERLFDPLKMASTGFQVPPTAMPRLATNYTVTPTGLVPLDPRETSVFLKPPSLLAGGAGLVSTARDFARIGDLLIFDGVVDNVRVMKPETTRLARSNLLPGDVRYVGGGYGAGMRVAAGGKTPHDAPGAVSWNGAAGTMWLVDPTRRLNFVFMSQFMPPTSYPVWTDVDVALDADRPGSTPRD